jgi:hypothetical protein
MIYITPDPFTASARDMSAIERDDIVRQTIAEAVNRINRQSGNATYRQAWKVAINILKGMEPKINKPLNDKEREISSISSRPV